jgi:hypothetical protein
MLTTMLEMQDEHNRLVAADWRARGFPFYRAIWVECAELLDHYGWKWWKRQHRDLAQVRLEVVDIFHFGLSDLMRDEVPLADIAARLAAPPLAADFHAAVEALAAAALARRRFPVAEFKAVMDALPLDLPGLFQDYVGKNMLNRLRQAHGYQDGSYVKVWAGREDNVHLVELMDGLDAAEPGYAARLWQRLEARYLATVTE